MRKRRPASVKTLIVAQAFWKNEGGLSFSQLRQAVPGMSGQSARQHIRNLLDIGAIRRMSDRNETAGTKPGPQSKDVFKWAW